MGRTAVAPFGPRLAVGGSSWEYYPRRDWRGVGHAISGGKTRVKTGYLLSVFDMVDVGDVDVVQQAAGNDLWLKPRSTALGQILAIR